MRVIDDTGKNVGILLFADALNLAREKELDLIEISPTANPPVAKIMDYGKFLYIEKRKTRIKPAHQTEIREARVGLKTSPHDLEVKAKKVSEFLELRDKVKIEMLLKGREKFLDKNFVEEKFKKILEFITVDYKITEGPKKSPRGLIMVLEKV